MESGRFGETVGLVCRLPPELGAVLEGQLFARYPECRIEMQGVRTIIAKIGKVG
jgi:hypothetical protein